MSGLGVVFGDLLQLSDCVIIKDPLFIRCNDGAEETAFLRIAKVNSGVAIRALLFASRNYIFRTGWTFSLRLSDHQW